ncbi:MAG: 4-hydroxy-3-methylbut-2-enyl diphosphate reductase [Dehalococcoidia bacterium]|nr:4-hydroxy-3-methylbut-2-enyl diphosphate reductase [Dehalococcoidia bacterium]MDW8119592.1 4-hydroxy-3-methylbut-2-enyl diphosphate reductase [Chloroflexota bacterium]
MEVILGSPRGFCAGVVRAIDIVELALQRFGPPVYVKHQIVHNPTVVASLEAKGAITVEDVDEVPPGSVVVFSAHGSPPQDYEKARARHLRVIDATCPLVTKVHNEARRYAKEGRRIILIGHRGHQEVRGTMGQTPMYLLDEREGIHLPPWDPDTPVAVLTQTTLSVDDTAKAVEAIRQRFPHAIVRNDLCYATTNRQAVVKALAQEADVILVIGAQNSSNCNRLREVAQAQGVPAYLINGPEELRPEYLAGAQKVGIISGASTPESLVQAVVDALSPQRVRHLTLAEEHISFVLPRELREEAPTP